MRFLRLLPLFFLLDSCVDPLPVSVAFQTGALVVDGLITDDPGPYTVRLTYASKPDTTTLRHPVYESGAEVWIFDDVGNNERLSETSIGVYTTDPTGIQGQLGTSYYLRIVTSKNVEYISTPQVMVPAGQVDNVYIEYKKDELIDRRNVVFDAFSIIIDASGSNEGPNLFRWRWSGTFKGETFPQFAVDISGKFDVPDPEPCSGYVRDGGGIRKVGECTCCICWATEYSPNALVSNNTYYQDRSFRHVEVALLPVTGQRFYEKYYAVVEQLSVSPEVYEFWKLAQAQQQSTGSLFQPNSVRIRGNIKCISDPKKDALGVFSVSAISRKSLFISREEVPFFIPAIDTFPVNCMEGLIGVGTTTKPPYW